MSTGSSFTVVGGEVAETGPIESAVYDRLPGSLPFVSLFVFRTQGVIRLKSIPIPDVILL